MIIFIIWLAFYIHKPRDMNHKPCKHHYFMHVKKKILLLHQNSPACVS